MKLRLKLMLMALILAVLPLVLTCAAAFWHFENKLRSEAVAYQRDMLKQLELNVVGEFRSATEMTRQLAGEATLVSYLSSTDSSASTLTNADVLKLFSRYSKLNDYIRGVALYDSRRQIKVFFSRQGHQAPLAMSDSEWQALQTSERGILSVDAASRLDGRSHMVRVAMAVVDEAAEESRRIEALTKLATPEAATLKTTTLKTSVSKTTALKDMASIGYIELWYELTPWQNLFRQAERRNTQFFLLDEFGGVLTGGSKITFDQLPVASMRSIVTDAAGDSRVLLKTDGLRQMLMLRSIDQSLFIGSLIDDNAIVDEVVEFLWVIAPSLLIVMGVAGLIFYVQVRRFVVYPVDRLIEATRQVALGNYKQKLKIYSKDEMGELALAFQHMGDKLDDSSRRIRELAFYDPLTGLPNRTTLRTNLEAALKRAERHNTKLAVLFIDLDDFKKVNDSLGHAAGDELLIQIAKRLTANVRHDDVLTTEAFTGSHDPLVSRRGGDEFNAVITNIKQVREAAVVAARVIEHIAQPIALMNTWVTVSASVGVAIFPDDATDADTLLRNADLAMYEAKAQGKNNYHIFTEAINQQVHERLQLESAIGEGLGRGEFELYYQPKVNLGTRRVCGIEALIRWNHPERGLVLPGEFIPLAEESNLIVKLSNWLLIEALMQLQLWQHSLPEGVRVAINVSPRQLVQSDFADQLIEMAVALGVSLRRLELEITETSMLDDETGASEQLQKLRERGVTTSLDDFGTGFSSLTFLRRLPLDSVKIDRSFVAQIEDGGEDQAIVQSLIEMCARLGLSVVAEGIETAGQLAFLVANGCHEGQGYLFARPMPAAEFLDFLNEPSAHSEYLSI